MSTICLVPPDLERKVLESLRAHFGDDIEVLVEQRQRERRSGADRRRKDKGPPKGTGDRRRIRNQPDAGGRRIGERRAALIPVDPPELPRKLRQYADQLTFCERIEHSPEQLEDMETARLVTRIQANGTTAFTELYERYFDQVYGYLRVLLRDAHEAEDVAQQVFTELFEALPRYERRDSPFRAWLFTVVRNQGLMQLRRTKRLDLVAPEELIKAAPSVSTDADAAGRVAWISDQDLMLFVERLPIPQRQVLVLRYMLDLSSAEIAALLDRTPEDVRTLQHRALRFLEQRLTAVGRAPQRRGRARMAACMRPANVLRARRYALN